MRPQILFPLFAEVSSLKGVGPKILPLVQKLAGLLVRDVLFLSPSGLIVRRPMTAANAVEHEVGIFEVMIDRLIVPGKPGVPIKVRASDDTGFVHMIWFGGSAQHIDRLLPKGQKRLVSGKVERFNAEGPAGLIDKKAPGQAPKLNASQKRALVQMIEDGPIPAVHGVVRWRLVDLAQWVWEEFRVTVSEMTLGRVVRKLGYRKLSARPRHHAQNPDAAAAFKKTSPPAWRRSRAARRRASA